MLLQPFDDPLRTLEIAPRGVAKPYESWTRARGTGLWDNPIIDDFRDKVAGLLRKACGKLFLELLTRRDQGVGTLNNFQAARVCMQGPFVGFEYVVRCEKTIADIVDDELPTICTNAVQSRMTAELYDYDDVCVILSSRSARPTDAPLQTAPQPAWRGDATLRSPRAGTRSERSRSWPRHFCGGGRWRGSR